MKQKYEDILDSTLKYLGGMSIALLGIILSIFVVRKLNSVIDYTFLFITITVSVFGFLLMIQAGSQYIYKKWGIEI